MQYHITHAVAFRSKCILENVVALNNPLRGHHLAAARLYA